MDITTIELRDVMVAWSRSMGAAGVAEPIAKERWVLVNAVASNLDVDPRWVTAQQLVTYLKRLETSERRNCYYCLSTWFQYLCRVGWLKTSPLDELVVRADFSTIGLRSRPAA